MSKIIIGFAGGTGSGKTTLANRVSSTFEGDCAVLRMDSYYKDFPELSLEEKKKINYDHPDSFDTERFIEDIRKLKNGESIQSPIYNYSAYKREDNTLTIESKKLIILEGLFLFENPELLDLIDLKIYVDTDADVRIIRRIMRDVKERGRNLDSVVIQYLSTVKPMHEKFIDPEKKKADIIVPEGGYNEVAFDMIVTSIKQKLQN